MASRKKAARSVKKKAATRPRAPRPARKSTRTASPRRKPARKATARRRPRSTTTLPAMALPAANGRPVGTRIGLTHHHMDFSTHDPEGVRRFFVDTLGFTNVLQETGSDYFTVFVTPTSSLGFMPPASTAPDQWQPPGEPNLYFFVSDVDAVFAKLSTEGVLFDQAPTDMPWGHRLAVLRDPEGRRVCLAQNLER